MAEPTVRDLSLLDRMLLGFIAGILLSIAVTLQRIAEKYING